MIESYIQLETVVNSWYISTIGPCVHELVFQLPDTRFLFSDHGLANHLPAICYSITSNYDTHNFHERLITVRVLLTTYVPRGYQTIKCNFQV